MVVLLGSASLLLFEIGIKEVESKVEGSSRTIGSQLQHFSSFPGPLSAPAAYLTHGCCVYY
jgi:hypothetical protein